MDHNKNTASETYSITKSETMDTNTLTDQRTQTIENPV